MVFFTSCSNIGKGKFLATYEYAKANPVLTERAGYRGKVCTVEINQSVVDCKVILETYEAFCFVEKYQWDIIKGESFSFWINPDSYFLTIVIDGKKYNDFVFNTYLPAWKVNLNNWIIEANNQHEESFLLSHKTK